MKKTLAIAALVVAGALLAGCSPADAPAREAHGGISKGTSDVDLSRDAKGPISKGSPEKPAGAANTISSVDVVEYAMPEGPSLIVTVKMTNDADVTADVVRQAVAESLAQATSAPSQVGLLFVHGEVFIDSKDGANEVLPGVEFSSGGPTFTGDQARAIVG